MILGLKLKKSQLVSRYGGDNVINKIVKFVLGVLLVLYALLPIMTVDGLGIFFSVVIVIILVILLFSQKFATINKNIYFIIVKPFLFIYSMFFLILILNPFILNHAAKYEVLIVRCIVIFLITPLIYYIIKSMFLIINQIQEIIYVDNKYYHFWYILIVFVIIVSPDIIFGLTIYDLIFSLNEENITITNWDKIYFSFSQHFLIDKSTSAEAMALGIKNDVTGQIALTAHALVNFFISITILTVLVKPFLRKYD